MNLNDKRLDEYASLLVRVGLNVQKGQTLIIASPVECAFFARKCAAAAYEAGCREVVMNWRDDTLARMKYLHADDAVFDEVPEWYKHLYNDYAAEGAAYLSISASDPMNLAGVDSDRLLRSNRARGEALRPFYTEQMSNGIAWCIASIPIPSWAEKVFPDLAPEEAMDALWDAILATVRVHGEGTAVAGWREHLARINERTAKLNELNFVSLHYRSGIGTDFTVSLPEGHLWQGGADTTKTGVDFVANMPTEEIFTAPERNSGNGILVASMPLVHDGNVIKGIRFRVENGKIVEATADEGEDVLRTAITIDEGASYFGELALVPYDSPISNQKILYYSTLFDENAACHIAFGEAYPCIKGGADMSKEELAAHGLNDSLTHVDFMIGTPDMEIVGTTHDGREIPVFKNGNFAL